MAAAAPALGQAPGAAPARPAPSAPTYAPQGEPMTFRLHQGQGLRGATRWVSATGQIQGNTAQQFEAFRRANAIDGLPLVLDSSGGRVTAAMAMGRIIRQARMTTAVGRTVGAGERDTVRTHEVRCASACVLALMGGVERHVSEDARIEVHMFSVELDAEGNKARAEPTFRDIEQTQRAMARHAVYLQEMGVAARYLEIMTEASFRGSMRRMTKDEIAATHLAFVHPREAVQPEGQGWLLSAPGAPPQLIRSARLSESDTKSLDHELVLECESVRGFFWVTYRQVLTRYSGPRGLQPVALRMARLETGGWDFPFRAPPRGLAINAQGGDLWMRRSVPRKVFDDALANRRLNIELTVGQRPTETAALFDPSLAQLLPELTRRCEARPGLVTVGPHPRR
jgi:hypothetical protein